MLGEITYLYLNSLSIIVLLCGKIPVSLISDGIVTGLQRSADLMCLR